MGMNLSTWCPQDATMGDMKRYTAYTKDVCRLQQTGKTQPKITKTARTQNPIELLIETTQHIYFSRVTNVFTSNQHTPDKRTTRTHGVPYGMMLQYRRFPPRWLKNNALPRKTAAVRLPPPLPHAHHHHFKKCTKTHHQTSSMEKHIIPNSSIKNFPHHQFQTGKQAHKIYIPPFRIDSNALKLHWNPRTQLAC